MKENLEIILIEDNPNDAKLVTLELGKQFNLLVHKVETREEFIESLQNYTPDIIVSDYSLPNFDGMLALLLRKQLAPDIPFVLVTGSLNEEIAVEVMKSGADDYILKENLIRLVPAIHAALEKKELIHSEKETKKALIESEEKYRRMVDHSPDAIIIHADGKVLYANHAAVKITCANSIEQIWKTPVMNFVHLDSKVSVLQRIKKIYETGEASDYVEEKLVRLNNETFIAEVIGIPIQYMGRLAVQTIARDITQRKEAESEIRESEDRFRMVFENVFDGISIYSEDPDPAKRKLIECNEQYANMAGRNRDELLQIGNTIGLQITLDERANDIRLGSLEKGIEYKGSFSWIRPDGKENFIEYVGMPITWHGKSYSIGIDRDITERKHAEAEIRKLSRGVHQSPAAIIITDKNGIIEYVNNKFSEVTGYTSSEIIGKNPRILQSGEKPIEEYVQLWNKILAGEEWRGEFHNKKKNGELFWEFASISAIKNDEGKITHFIAIKEDITEHKKMLEELIQAKENAEHSDKLKTEFLAQMSHEVRTPIHVINSNVEFLNEIFGNTLEEDVKSCFEGIGLASQRIIRTMELILNYAELQTTGYKPEFLEIDLDDQILNPLVSQYKRTGEKNGVPLFYNNRLEHPKIIADDYSVKQIFANLIDNAIKYSKNGKVEILIDKDGAGKIFVQVKDNGIGMSSEFLSKIYEPFVQEEQGYSRSFEGNGLGLALVQKYCKINNAIIEVESKKNIGSTFRVTFFK